MQSTRFPRAGVRAALPLLAVLASLAGPRAQDNVLVFGNSIVQGPTTAYFADIVTQSGKPTPNLFTYIVPNAGTANFVNQVGLITSSLPAGQTWQGVVIQGQTLENSPVHGNPAAFQANMMTIANAFFAHSPNGTFVGHETGADHPNSSNYPMFAPSPETWLMWSHDGYAAAAAAITAAHPASPFARVAEQGTCFAATAGYPLHLFAGDLHHLSVEGQVLSAMLWYVQIYGGRIEDIAVDFSSSTPLVNRLNLNGIDESEWLRLVGFADRSQPAAARPYPGSSGDFQLRAVVDASIANLVTHQTATSQDTLHMQLFSPLGAAQNAPAVFFGQLVPSGQSPNGGVPPELWLDPTEMRILLQVTTLPATLDITIPHGIAGHTFWLQAASYSGPGNSRVYSDAQLVTIQ